MIIKKLLIIFMSLIFLSCTQNIVNPTDVDFPNTEIYGDVVNLKLKDGTSALIKVDFHNIKGIYGSGKGYQWEDIQKLTIENKRDSKSSHYSSKVVGFLMSPLIAAGAILAVIYGGIVCSISDCTK